MESKKQETKLALEELIRGIRKPNATHSTKNAEVEGQEHGKDAMGNVNKFVGKKHEDGGMPMQLEDGEKILSDNQKPKKDYAKLLEEKYKVKVAPKDTYASILDKINSKIGFKKIEDEQLKIANKLEKNDKVKDENTKMLNEQAYQKRLGDLEMIKEFKNEKKEEAFDDLYAMQEDGKIENGEYIDEESGVEVKFENGGMMFKKGHLPLLTRVKLSNGYRTQEEVNNHFSNKFKSGGMKKKSVEYFQAGGKKSPTQIFNEFARKYNVELEGTSNRLVYTDGTLQYSKNGASYVIYPNGRYMVTNKEGRKTMGTATAGEDIVDDDKTTYSKFGEKGWFDDPEYLQKVNKKNTTTKSPVKITTQTPATQTEIAKNMAKAESGVRTTLDGSRKDEKLAEQTEFLQKWSDKLRANKYGQIEHPTQHITTKGEANLYNLTPDDYQSRIAEYYQLFPELAAKHFPVVKGKDGKEQYKKLSNSETKAFQEDYDKYAKQAIKKYGLSADEEAAGLSNIAFNPALKQGESARTYDGKMGLFTSSRSGFQAPILPKEKIAALNKAGIYHISSATKDTNKLFELGLSVSDVAKLKEEKAKFGDYYMLPTDSAPATSAPVAPAVTPVVQADTPTSNDEIPLPNRLNNPRYTIPVQHTPPPTSLKLPMLITPQVRDQTFVKISPEQAIRENQRGLNYMGEQLRETESGVQGAAFANFAGKMFEANNEAVSAANIWNANQRVNYDNEMSKRFDVNEVMRQQFLGSYVDKTNEATELYENDWRSYFMKKDALERLTGQDAGKINYAESASPNQNVDPYTGKITYTTPRLTSYFNNKR